MSIIELKRRQVLAGLGAALAAPAFVKRAHAAEITLRLHHFLPQMAPMQTEVFEPWAKKLAEASNGAVEVQIFPSMQLGGKPPQLADQARQGIADITWALPTYTPGRYPVAETMGLPFMVTNAERTSVAVHQVMDEFGQSEFQGSRPLAFWVHAGGKLHMRDNSITTAADMAGKKIRSPNVGMGDLLATLGAEPVFFPVTDMVVGLSNGVIDGCCLPYEAVPPFKLQELTRFTSETAPGARGLYGNTNTILMGQRTYDRLPDDIRSLIDQNTGIEFSRHIGQVFDKFEAIGRDAVVEQGNEIVEISVEEIARWEEAARPVHEGWIETLNRAGHDGAAILTRANALLDEV